MVLIDEIENGFHHSILIDVWKAVLDAADRNKTQVFATTHSIECIRAAYEAASSRLGLAKDEFFFHRIDRADGTVKARTYDVDTLGAALASHLETR
jgi:AAA15 family ATPase/GTPase